MTAQSPEFMVYNHYILWGFKQFAKWPLGNKKSAATKGHCTFSLIGQGLTVLPRPLNCLRALDQ